MKKMHQDVGLSTSFPMVVADNDEHDPISDLTCDQCMYKANSGRLSVRTENLVILAQTNKIVMHAKTSLLLEPV